MFLLASHAPSPSRVLSPRGVGSAEFHGHAALRALAHSDVRAMQGQLPETCQVDLLGELIGHDPDQLMAEALWRELEASSPEGRLRQFTFDVFDVDLDFRDGTAVIHDVLDAQRSETYPLSVLRERLPRPQTH